MGGLCSKKGAAVESKKEDEKELRLDNRKRNSLVFAVTDWVGTDFGKDAESLANGAGVVDVEAQVRVDDELDDGVGGGGEDEQQGGAHHASRAWNTFGQPQSSSRCSPPIGGGVVEVQVAPLLKLKLDRAVRSTTCSVGVERRDAPRSVAASRRTVP